MTDCNEPRWLFQDLGKRKVEVDFGGGYLSSDGGGLILRELERHSGLLRALGNCFVDHRDPRYVEHRLEELLAQRIQGLVLGYEDLNDHDQLRRDPLQALLCGKSDPLGQDRPSPRDHGKALAAHSTLNRLELSAEALDGRYRKIQAQPDKIEALLIQRGVKSIPRRSAEIVLDFDATDDPLHGNQQGAYFHGYYRGYCYLPLYCFCGNIPLLAQLARLQTRRQCGHRGSPPKDRARHSAALWPPGAHHRAGRQRVCPRRNHELVRSQRSVLLFGLGPQRPAPKAPASPL